VTLAAYIFGGAFGETSGFIADPYCVVRLEAERLTTRKPSPASGGSRSFVVGMIG